MPRQSIPHMTVPHRHRYQSPLICQAAFTFADRMDERRELLEAIRVFHCGYNIRTTINNHLERLGGLAAAW
jgi:hypothetical protein